MASNIQVICSKIWEWITRNLNLRSKDQKVIFLSVHCGEWLHIQWRNIEDDNGTEEVWPTLRAAGSSWWADVCEVNYKHIVRFMTEFHWICVIQSYSWEHACMCVICPYPVLRHIHAITQLTFPFAFNLYDKEWLDCCFQQLHVMFKYSFIIIGIFYLYFDWTSSLP